MSKIAVVYWSGTGNTEAMANEICDGIKAGGMDCELYNVSDFKGNIADYSKIALGCPAMGDEVLEESEFEPFYSSINISGKKIAIFGSYGWGDGQWMRDWEERMKAAGAEVACGEGVITQETPDDDALAKCKELGKTLAAV